MRSQRSRRRDKGLYWAIQHKLLCLFPCVEFLNISGIHAYIMHTDAACMVEQTIETYNHGTINKSMLTGTTEVYLEERPTLH